MKTFKYLVLNQLNNSLWGTVILWSFAFNLCSLNAYGQKIFNVKDYGATGKNKKEVVTSPIQATIDECHSAGGGTVYFPPGEYLSGTLVLKSNVNFHLDHGAVLYASQDEEDYQVPFDIYKHNNPNQPVLLYAEDAKNISITGKGTIHGQARRVYEELRDVDGFIEKETENARQSGVEMKKYYKIPPFVSLIYLVSCEHVEISDIRVIESVDWSVHVQWSENVTIRNCYIYTSLEAGVNADGLDIDGCKNVTISDCIIETGDDAIVLKSTLTRNRSEDCENITVTNSVLTSTSAALKIGTETYGDFRNIVFSNCVVKDSNRGFSIVVRDGGTVQDVLVSNITMELNRKAFYYWGDADPIWLVIKKRSENSKVGVIKNISFDHIIAHGQGTSKLEGYQGSKLKNISLNNIQLNMHPEATKDKRATHALIASKVENLHINGLSIYWDEEQVEPFWGSALMLEDVDFLNFDRFYGRQGIKESRYPVIILDKVGKGILRNVEPETQTETLIRLKNSKKENFKFIDLDSFGQATEVVSLE
jgi:polygalacturonase